MPDNDDKKPIAALTAAQVTSWPVDTSRTSISGERLPEAPTKREQDEQFLELARERFKLCVDAEQDRRTEMLLDLKFRAGDQWEPAIRARREKAEFSRPCLTINRIPGFIKHVVNNMRQARPAIKIEAVGDGADEEQADIRQGLIRHIEVNSDAETAYDTAFEHMCVTGLGWMRVVDDWADPKSMDKELFVRWVSNPFNIYSDPFRQMPDWSDMKFAFVIEDVTKAEFKARFGDDTEAASLSNYQSIGDHATYWFPPGGKIRIAEYFYIEPTDDMLYRLQDGRIVLLSEIDEPPADDEIVEERKCKVPKVYWSLISAVDVLDRREWKGQFIPLIPVIGNQIEVDGQEHIVGMVRFAREPQRLYNYMYSSFVETVALAPRNQFIAEFGQIAEFRALWERANVDPMAVLPYKMQVTEQGQLVPPPQRQSAAVDLTAFVAGLQMADQQLKSVFNIYDASLGQRGPQESGLAINARKIESDTGTYDWGDNFIRALRHLGRVLNDLLEHYYNSPGKIVQILREDQTKHEVLLNQEHTNPQNEIVKYDLSQGKYAEIVTTEPSYETKRQEARAGMIDLVKADPAILQVAGDLLVRLMGLPTDLSEAIAGRLEKALPPGLKEPDEDAPKTSPEDQAKMAQMQQMIQQLTQAVHTLSDKREELRMKEEFSLLRTELTNTSNQIIQLLKTGHAQAEFLSNKTFEEAERQRAEVEAQFQPPPAQGQQ